MTTNGSAILSTEQASDAWKLGHVWSTEGEPRSGGQHVGVGRRRYRCLRCGVVTEYTRESMVRFLAQQPPCILVGEDPTVAQNSQPLTLMDRIKSYMWHRKMCAALPDYGRGDCDCGLDSLIRDITGETSAR